MSYNLAGMMTSSTLPNGKSISTDYDRMGRITAVTSDWVDADHPAVLANNFAYHATGALTGIDYGNGTTSTRSYTSGGLLKTLQHGDGVDPGALLDLEYHYDEGLANNGRIMEITDHDDASRTQSHAYDGFYRLATAETQGPHWGLSFSYDRYGNRLSQSATKGSPPTHSATVDAYSNRMTAWSYDEAGNVLGDTRHSYAFDANNKIVSMDSGTATYAYDAQGSRVKKTVGGAITYYFWGHEYVSGWSKFHIFLGGRKLAEYSGGTTRFFHLNHLGTPMARTNMSGAQDASWTHYPLGEEWTSSEPSDDQHRFSGHMRDSESGNEYAGARYLSSEGGRWLGVDSVRGASDLPQTLNRFAYALDDPINFIDRDGNQPVVGQTVCTVTVTGEWDGGHFIVHGYWGSCDSYFARERGYGGGGFGGPGAGGHGGRPSNGSGQVDAHMIRNKQIRKSIEDFLKEHSDCATIVAGFDTKWQTKVASVQFYDVRSESIWSELALQLVAHGLQTSKGNPWGGTLGDYFARRPEGTIATVVTGYRNGQPSTEPLVLLGARYFDADYLKKHELTKDAIATHEFLHVITGLTDPELAKRLKLEFKKGEASKAIQRFIQDGCPKEE